VDVVILISFKNQAVAHKVEIRKVLGAFLQFKISSAFLFYGSDKHKDKFFKKSKI
jgi:hypothetical protein